MRRVAQVLGKTAVCAVARAAPAPLAPASRAAIAVAPVRPTPASLCTAGQPSRWVRSDGAVAFARRPRARPRGRERAGSSRGARAVGVASARLGDAARCDASRAEIPEAENTANGPTVRRSDPIGRFPFVAPARFADRSPVPDFPEKYRADARHARAVFRHLPR